MHPEETRIFEKYEMCRETLNMFDKGQFSYVNNIVTGDETWDTTIMY